jgi:Cytochrome P460
MPHSRLTLPALSALLIFSACSQNLVPANSQNEVITAAPAPNGITLPQGYQDWRIIAVSHRTDNESLRAILGNDIAIKAARAGQTKPWPDGSILAKLVWKDAVHEGDWPDATVPGKFIHAEFMLKDEQKYAQTGGWGFARWLGEDQKPYGEDASFVQECFACHTPMKTRDYVFTRPAPLPQ